MENNKITTNEKMPDEELWTYEPDGRSSDETYTSILDGIRKLYPEGKLSEMELHEATRNYIEFVRILLEYHENKCKE